MNMFKPNNSLTSSTGAKASVRKTAQPQSQASSSSGADATSLYDIDSISLPQWSQYEARLKAMSGIGGYTSAKPFRGEKYDASHIFLGATPFPEPDGAGYLKVTIRFKVVSKEIGTHFQETKHIPAPKVRNDRTVLMKDILSPFFKNRLRRVEIPNCHVDMEIYVKGLSGFALIMHSCMSATGKNQCYINGANKFMCSCYTHDGSTATELGVFFPRRKGRSPHDYKSTAFAMAYQQEIDSMSRTQARILLLLGGDIEVNPGPCLIPDCSIEPKRARFRFCVKHRYLCHNKDCALKGIESLANIRFCKKCDLAKKKEGKHNRKAAGKRSERKAAQVGRSVQNEVAKNKGETDAKAEELQEKIEAVEEKSESLERRQQEITEDRILEMQTNEIAKGNDAPLTFAQAVRADSKKEEEKAQHEERMKENAQKKGSKRKCKAEKEEEEAEKRLKAEMQAIALLDKLPSDPFSFWTSLSVFRLFHGPHGLAELQDDSIVYNTIQEILDERDAKRDAAKIGKKLSKERTARGSKLEPVFTPTIITDGKEIGDIVDRVSSKIQSVYDAMHSADGDGECPGKHGTPRPKSRKIPEVLPVSINECEEAALVEEISDVSSSSDSEEEEEPPVAASSSDGAEGSSEEDQKVPADDEAGATAPVERVTEVAPKPNRDVPSLEALCVKRRPKRVKKKTSEVPRWSLNAPLPVGERRARNVGEVKPSKSKWVGFLDQIAEMFSDPVFRMASPEVHAGDYALRITIVPLEVAKVNVQDGRVAQVDGIGDCLLSAAYPMKVQVVFEAFRKVSGCHRLQQLYFTEGVDITTATDRLVSTTGFFPVRMLVAMRKAYGSKDLATAVSELAQRAGNIVTVGNDLADLALANFEHQALIALAFRAFVGGSSSANDFSRSWKKVS